MSSVLFPRINILRKSSMSIIKNSTRFHYRQTVSESDSYSKFAFAQIWKKLFGKYLLTTNTVSAGILLMTGDIISQEIEYRRNKLTTPKTQRYDWMRVGRMFAVGCIQGPLHHYFYRWMDKVLPITSMKTTIAKILLDQLIMSPLCIMLFFYPACILERKSLEESNRELLQKFILVYSVDWCVWPGAQFINFHYLHPKYRVIYVNIVTVVYNMFLSYVKHHDVSSLSDFN